MKRSILACLFLATTCLAWSQPIEPARLESQLEKVVPQAVDHYKWFHANPELSNQETRTAAYLAKELAELGYQVTPEVGGTGLVAVLKNGEGPTVLYRADMDGLPVMEATGLPYASENDGVMHACGHDVHMATAIGTLTLLAQNTDAWKGTLLFVGQPAEELGSGARQMLADPKFQSVLKQVGKPRVCLALHDDAGFPAGRVGLKEGFVCANVDEVDLVIHGTGGHGAYPHKTVDPIVMGAEIVTALQTIVSRKLKPGTKAVVTVGRFDAGTKHNIIPPTATLLLTVRSYETEVRERVLDEIERIAQAVARAHGAPRAPEMSILDPYVRAGYNEPEWCRRAISALDDYFPPEEIAEDDATMGGEDFFEFGLQLDCPNLMMALGTVDRKVYDESKVAELPGLHSDRFAPEPNDTLKGGIKMMTVLLLDAFR